MPRIALGVSYLGGNYSGLQRLQTGRSVVAELEQALAAIADQPIHLYAAGRTDKGVHALQQVMHFDSHSKRDNHKWCEGTNARLPQDIRLLWVRPVANDFHARFSANSRRYAYLIANSRRVDAAMHGLCHTYHKPLNLSAMCQACAGIVGEYNCVAFTTSCAPHSHLRHLDWIRVHAKKPWILIDIQANAFLRRMARMLATELLNIGAGLCPPHHLADLLKSGTARAHKIAAPAKGLFLASVGYSSAWNLPLQPAYQLWPYQLAGVDTRIRSCHKV